MRELQHAHSAKLHLFEASSWDVLRSWRLFKTWAMNFYFRLWARAKQEYMRPHMIGATDQTMQPSKIDSPHGWWHRDMWYLGGVLMQAPSWLPRGSICQSITQCMGSPLTPWVDITTCIMGTLPISTSSLYTTSSNGLKKDSVIASWWWLSQPALLVDKKGIHEFYKTCLPNNTVSYFAFSYTGVIVDGTVRLWFRERRWHGHLR